MSRALFDFLGRIGSDHASIFSSPYAGAKKRELLVGYWKVLVYQYLVSHVWKKREP